eukprot:5752417-Pyramimonas_sp.AAC.1
MAPPPNFGAPLTPIPAPKGAPPMAPVGKFARNSTPVSGHPSHRQCPHRELHRGPQRHGSHA